MVTVMDPKGVGDGCVAVSHPAAPFPRFTVEVNAPAAAMMLTGTDWDADCEVANVVVIEVGLTVNPGLVVVLEVKVTGTETELLVPFCVKTTDPCVPDGGVENRDIVML
jgi:hypothetical protein